MRELYPQHFAMTFGGFATGLRPSSLRPLLRRGPMADVLWDQGRLLVRRSQTLGDEVMNTTKQGMVLDHGAAGADGRAGLARPDATHDARAGDSDLLFPSVKGGYRFPSVLNKPFADVCEAMSLGRHFSQRGLRRTFNYLARAAELESVVIRSISGHLTEQMQLHYSTVNPAEQRRSIGKVIDLMQVREQRAGGTQSAPNGTQPDAGEGLLSEPSKAAGGYSKWYSAEATGTQIEKTAEPRAQDFGKLQHGSMTPTSRKKWREEEQSGFCFFTERRTSGA